MSDAKQYIGCAMRTFFWNDTQHFCCFIDAPGDVRQNIVKELLTNDIIGTQLLISSYPIKISFDILEESYAASLLMLRPDHC